MFFVFSLGETCSHVATVLFNVEADVNPVAPIAQIRFYSKKAKDCSLLTPHTTPPPPYLPEDQCIKFLSKLSAETREC